jgi:hypothetical protein
MFLLPQAVNFYLYRPASAGVQAIYLDGGENVYFVRYDKNDIIIFKTSSEGDAEGSCSFPRYDKYDFAAVDGMAFGENGGAYCAVSRIDSRNFTVSYQCWLEINFSKGTSDIIYEEFFPEERRLVQPAGTRLLVEGDILRSVTVRPDELVFNDFDVTEKTRLSSAVYETVFDGGAGMADAYPINGGAVIASTALGEVFRLNPDRSHEKLYGDAKKAGGFSRFAADANGGVYLYLHGENRWIKGVGQDFADTRIRAFGGLWQGYILDETRYAFIKDDGQSAELYANGEITEISAPERSRRRATAVSIAAGAGLACLYACAVFLADKKKIKISLLYKQAVIILAVLGAGVFAISKQASDALEKQHEDNIIFSLRKTAHKMSNLFDADDLGAIDLSDPSGNPVFEKITRNFRYAVDVTKLQKLLPDGESAVTTYENHYVCALLRRDGEWRAAYYDNYYVNAPVENIIGTKAAERYNAFLERGDYDGAVMGFDDGNGDWIAVIVPVFDSAGNPAALMETGISKRQYVYETQLESRRVAVRAGAVMAGGTVFILAGLWFSLNSLKRLRKAVEAAGNGEYKTVPVKGRDEIALISSAFNLMSSRIESHTRNLEEHNRAYFRFIPAQLLKKLGKDSILSVRRGDWRHIDAHILYISFVNLNEVTEKMDDSQTFAFFNRVYGEISGRIIAGGGVAETCGQSELVCLFDDAKAAYSAALAVNRRLDGVNATLFKKLKCASSIVSGGALIGVAGHEKRLCTTTLSGAVKLSGRLAEIAAHYGVRIICPADTLKPNFARFMGNVGFDGKNAALYDCYEGDETEAFMSKREHGGVFERGVEKFEEGEWYEAKRLFIKFLKAAPSDLAVKRYLFMCERNETEAKPLLFGEQI